MYEWIRRNLLIVQVDNTEQLKTEKGQTKVLETVPAFERRGKREFIYDGILHRSGLWAIFRIARKPSRKKRLSQERGAAAEG